MSDVDEVADRSSAARQRQRRGEAMQGAARAVCAGAGSCSAGAGARGSLPSRSGRAWGPSVVRGAERRSVRVAGGGGTGPDWVDDCGHHFDEPLMKRVKEEGSLKVIGDRVAFVFEDAFGGVDEKGRNLVANFPRTGDGQLAKGTMGGGAKFLAFGTPIFMYAVTKSVEGLSGYEDRLVTMLVDVAVYTLVWFLVGAFSQPIPEGVSKRNWE